MRAAREGIEAFLERERAQLPPWLVVGLGTGIAGWFALDRPAAWLALIALASGTAIAASTVRAGRADRALAWFMAAVALGCAFIWVRSELVAAPRLDRPMVTTFEARVEKRELLAAKGDVRLTLATADSELPPRVRVSATEEAVPEAVTPGAVVGVRARLAPPPPMALPGTYDFAPDAWFRQIGAVGRGLGEVQLIRPGSTSGLDRVREDLGPHIRERLPGGSGGIATALANGDQYAVQEDDAEAMRRSGLTHLLSVSGLHIAAVVGATMLLTLKLLALSERLALRMNLPRRRSGRRLRGS